jgi:hypothetical protein
MERAGEGGTVLALQEARAQITVFGEAEGEFEGAGGAIGVGDARLKRRQVMRPGQQSRDGVLGEPCGIAVLALFGEARGPFTSSPCR